LKILWITRASPGAEATAARLRSLGYEPLVAPVLEVRRLPATIDLAGVAALAFTSANGVRAFAALCDERDRLVFAVGAATAEAARAAGFAAVQSADGDVDALVRTLATVQLAGPVLHPGAAEPAGHLVRDLARLGVTARAVTVYETVAAALPAGFLDGLAGFDGVLVYSPRAGRRLAELLRHTAAPNLRAYCLSPEVAATLRGLAIGPLIAAPLPNEDALLSLIVG
jgi:uroporphyrinogen-III synthase